MRLFLNNVYPYHKICLKFYKSIEKELSLTDFFIRYCDSSNILHNSFFKLLDIDITVLINSNKNKYNELFDNYINKTSFINKILSFNNFILDLDDSLQSRRLFRILLLDTFDSLYINENLEITIVLK